MITPSAWTVACDAWECSAPREGRVYTRSWSKPLTVQVSTRKAASAAAKRAGWSQPHGSGWWCPRHTAQARQLDTERARRTS